MEILIPDNLADKDAGFQVEIVVGIDFPRYTPVVRRRRDMLPAVAPPSVSGFNVAADDPPLGLLIEKVVNPAQQVLGIAD